jgi:hypothetical protein
MDEVQRLSLLEQICLPLLHHASGDYNKWRLTSDGRKAMSYEDAERKLKDYFKEHVK